MGRQVPRRKRFISYHHNDESDVLQFIQRCARTRGSFIARGIGAKIPGDVIQDTGRDHIMRRVRETYLRDSAATIVMIGRCTWVRWYVDWEIA
ncbi:TIR domain-containing protein [Streptomyces longwoodensis]|uniref:TIR domain-containing protein n=1 Tax=Streptomyces longwoodensis TaxID=68231 RepID=UPI003823C9C1